LSACTGTIVLGEIFKNPEAIEWGTDFQIPPEDALLLYKKDPVSFLEQYVYGEKPHWVHAFGFKLFYYHAQAEPWDAIWPHLQEHTEVRILHVKRRNILRTHLSRARAVQTDQWVRVTKEHQKFPAVHLEYEACLHDFVQTRAWEKQFEEFFKQHPIMDVYYEDLATDYSTQMTRIQRFLELPDEHIQPQTYKQANDSLEEAIVNFSELKARFAGTEWEEFFNSGIQAKSTLR
jgi:LPS sulfotransferase NodH